MNFGGEIFQKRRVTIISGHSVFAHTSLRPLYAPKSDLDKGIFVIKFVCGAHHL